jgi:integrase
MALYKRPNSKYWWMKFTFDGELVQQSTKCKKKRDAETVESAYRTQLALGKIGIKPLPKAPAFDKAIDEFLEWLKTEHAEQPSTYRRYYYSCQALKEYFGKVKVSFIQAKDVEKFLAWRGAQTSRKTKETVSRRTVNFDLSTLKMFFRRLMRAKCLRENPTETIKQLSESLPPFHVLTDREEKKYILSCPQPLKDVAALMLETGMRPGEIYRLERKDVNKNYLQVVKGKTPAARRKVYLTEKARAILSDRLQRFDGKYLFPQNDIDGQKATADIGDLHLACVNSLNFKFRLYDCRHTFATRALEKGTDLVTLASILGHANLKMVMRYAHPSEKLKEDAMRRMEPARKKGKQKQSDLQPKVTFPDT